ncbi:MAG TPA: SusC/RagA family TonB-linked outer membrane protein [Chryseolinea sp.]|nr:SusC/RagA family TonB-linked outer membrane protein [Chryseolinea sp.]
MKRILLLLFGVVCALYSHAQDRNLTGKIVDEAQEGLPGVNVILKGTTIGTVSSSDGTFSLAVPQTGGTLVFSFIGLATQEVVIGNENALSVKMTTDVRQLSEVVVTGVGVATDKRKIAISVASVSASDLPQAPTASIDQALVGKVAGAQISSTSGTPGAPVNILLRGINTINRGTSPMVLIDGVQMSATAINTIDLSTIDRVEVVQGAAAATIYGAQGANGVIQLFTKKGKAGKLNVDISSGFSRNEYLNIGDVKKAERHAFVTDANNVVIGASGNALTVNPATGAYSENVQYNSLGPTVTNSKAYDQNLLYYDHFELFFKPANTINNSISVSGGSDKIDFSLSASNSHQESNVVENGYWDRSNFTANVGATLAKGLSIRSVTNVAFTKSTLKTRDRDIIFQMMNAYPFADFEATTTDGSIPYYLNQTIGINSRNPLFRQAYTNNDDKKIDIIQSFNVNYKFPKFVELDAKYGLNYQVQERELEYLNQSKNANVEYWRTQNSAQFISNYNTANTGDITKYNNSITFQNFIASSTFTFDFKEDFNTNFPLKSSTQVLFDWRKNMIREFTTAAMGLPASYQPYNAANTGSWRVYRDYEEPFVTYGYLVNQRFDYDDFVGISGGFRSDYSSAFGEGSKPFTFGRGDAYLRLSALDFWENSSISSTIPEFKVRAAYGQAGIQPKPFDRYVTVTPSTVGANTAFFYTHQQSNSALGVEVSSEFEVGMDVVFSLFKNTPWLNDIAVSPTYWDRRTESSIFNVDVAPSVGLGTLKDNAFTIGSSGFQLSLNSTVYSGSNFNWNATVNYGNQTSEILSVVGGQPILMTAAAGSTNYILQPGLKIGQLYGNKMLNAVDAVDENGNFHIPEAQQANYAVASNGYVVDKATKQPFLTANKYSFGDPNPKFNMSFINDFTYKSFLSIGFQVDWVYKSHLYNQTKGWMYRDGIHSDYAVPFSVEGEEPQAWTAFYRGVYAARIANGTKDYFYEDATFMRLRNVSIGVDFAKVFNIPVFKRLQLVLSGRNLWTLTDYTGFDPEISSDTSTEGSSAWDRGTDHNTMPNFKSYQATLNIGF